MSAVKTRADYAVRYVERFGMALTWMADGSKRPTHERWNCDEQLIRTPEQARRRFSVQPLNMGGVLKPSGLCSLDADRDSDTYTILAAEGIDLDQLISSCPTIKGRAPRIMFKAPAGIQLQRRVLQWPDADKPGELLTVFEFRAGRVQDVLPPSMHPDTKRPYVWLTPPKDGFPTLPDELLALWRDWDRFRLRARNLCPWADPEAAPAPIKSQPAGQRTGRSVIELFNQAYDVGTILATFGYKLEGKRFKSPSAHGASGVVLLDGGERCYCHNTSDVLGDGKPHDCFDTWAILEHRGDVRAAVRAAAKILGMDRRAP